MTRTKGIRDAVRSYNDAYDSIGANIYCDCESGRVFAKWESGWTDFGPNVVNLRIKGKARDVDVRWKAMKAREEWVDDRRKSTAVEGGN